MPEDYFAGGRGFRFDMKSVLLGGPITEWYDRQARRWVVGYEAAGRRWEGVGESKIAAVLDLIAQRMESPTIHRPRRGSDVEAWIKRHRDEAARGNDGSVSGRVAEAVLDELLEDYRLRADVAGTYLDTPRDEIGPPNA